MSKRITTQFEYRAPENRQRGGTLEERQTDGLIRRWLRLANDFFRQENDRDNDPTPSAA